MTLTKGITFDEFIILREKDYPNASGNLSKLLRDIGLAAKVINREVNKAGLVDILGRADSTNIHDEDQQKLDVFANDILIKYLSVGGQCCCVASEEMDDILPVESEAGRQADYVVVFDPLDGSSNIDINASIGTIFTVFRRRSERGTVATEADVLQTGRDVVAAGYVIYGSSTMLVYSAGNGVNGFTLDPSIGEFCLSHPDIETPATGPYYSVNQGKIASFGATDQAYIERLVGEGLGLRYIGSMVGDVHRTLLKGGVFLYPANARGKAKLRLLYECIPMGYLAERAGGRATTGEEDMLDVTPTELHQRVPVILGSRELVGMRG